MAGWKAEMIPRVSASAKGASAPDIAARLFLSTATVTDSASGKLDVSDRAAAVAAGLRRGLIR